MHIYKCSDCKEIFTEDEIVSRQIAPETWGYHGGTPAEYAAEAPCCGSEDYEDAPGSGCHNCGWTGEISEWIPVNGDEDKCPACGKSGGLNEDYYWDEGIV